ncbi:ribosomal-protein-S5-alanine N-acetyltransferase [Kluyvera cryocrescens]|uniref:Ribosomal-protein-S5-alanine N-acetyltransferase n=1 Tax=Kluyvera cryocrescens TaxID=580 RepID=A0A485CCL0_KLUCR|nr:ribosomal-protein-S5-alanine N-acetyltransferase [Kluyvera cryocrescens]
MFGYRSSVPKIRLTTDRMVVRLVHDRDAWRLADYYAENRQFLKPWEPVRDDSHCYPSGWQARLSMINEFHKQGTAFYFALLDPEEKEIIGVANFSNVVRGSFHACYLGYSIGQKWQGQGDDVRGALQRYPLHAAHAAHSSDYGQLHAAQSAQR